MLLISALASILFLGGYLGPAFITPGASLGFKVAALAFGFVWVRGTFPRFRYDGLMSIMWKTFLPLSLGFVLFVPSILIWAV